MPVVRRGAGVVTYFGAKLRPIILAVLDAWDADADKWDEDRWLRFMVVLDETARAIYGLPSHFTYDADLFAAVSEATDMIAGATSDLRIVRDAIRGDVSEAAPPAPAPVVSEPAPNMHIPFLAAAPAAAEPPRAAADASAEAEAMDAPLPPAPADVVAPVAPRDAPPSLLCPECGKDVKNSAGLGSHRRAAHGGVRAAAPMPGKMARQVAARADREAQAIRDVAEKARAVDVPAARDDFAARRLAGAKAKADEAWRDRHPEART